MYIIHMSPTLFHLGAYRIVVYPKDHYPEHVHVVGPDAEAKINLSDMECTFSRGFTERALKRILEFVKNNKEELLEAWHEYQE